MSDRQNAETLAASTLLAAAAIVAAEADERGIPPRVELVVEHRAEEEKA